MDAHERRQRPSDRREMALINNLLKRTPRAERDSSATKRDEE
jgi:hypothetical protein